ncbi:MAG TPA: 4-hydroxy-3-methylbut-2-enyl diphosphate reductase [Armatimonadota bacterium]|jgi:4-hydroxy-3-methylbut-2-enyl diphosphate reductase
MDVLLANPRGFCAGVERAIEIVEKALEQYGPPVYVRKEIVHNPYVVGQLKKRGAVFVEDLDEVPQGGLAIFSAHGVSPSVWEQGKQRDLRVVDATCPLVTKVHREVARYVAEGRTVLLIGHAGHDEVIGTLGQSPQNTRLVGTAEDVAAVDVPDPSLVGVVTQTTLSVDDTREVLEAIRRRFPLAKTPAAGDICYASQNRQNAVKVLAEQADVILVVGAPNSSNAQRLREVAERCGARGYLIDYASQIQPEWLEGATVVGVSAGASTPETLVQDVVHWLEEHHPTVTRQIVVTEEHVVFPLPSQLISIGT